MDSGYSFRLLLDESMEHSLLGRLTAAGHDVEHVELVPALGKGSRDTALCRRSRNHNRFIVTYDEDFVTDFDERDYLATRYIEDAGMGTSAVARAVDTMARFYPPDEVRGLVPVGREWLID